MLLNTALYSNENKESTAKNKTGLISQTLLGEKLTPAPEVCGGHVHTVQREQNHLRLRPQDSLGGHRELLGC